MDSIPSTVQFLQRDDLDRLPADRIEGMLLLRPGITATSLGELSLRGGSAGDAAVYLDGIPVLSGSRGLPFFRSSIFEANDARITAGTNAIEQVSVNTGPLPASMGNGRAGAISYRTRSETGRVLAALGLESGEVLGGSNSLGSTRVEGSLGGALSSRLSVFAAGVLEGQRGMTVGFDADRATVFVPAGLDTTLTMPDPLNPAQNISVPVYNYAVARGNCEDFSGSENQEIADNFGEGCQGSRTPASGLSSYQFLGKMTYRLGRDGHVSLLAAASQDQNRNFDYGNFENPQALTGNRGSSAVYALSVRQPLRRSGAPITLEAHLSYQTDRQLSGPLNPETAADLNSGFGGLAVGPLDHRFNFDNFPLNDELVRNVRFHLQGSRRSPLDLENPAQYALIDEFRNNAYGLYHRAAVAPLQFFEQGGPVGLLTMYRENRWVAASAFDWTVSRAYRVRIGGEFSRLTVGNYSHLLTDTFNSDVYLEHPTRAAVFAENHVALGPVTVTAGLRLDHYRTGARHPAFPVIISHPQYNPLDPEALLEDESIFPEDESHRALSPRLQFAAPISGATVFRAGYAQQVQVPDVRLALAGINTDINLGDAQQAFGSDLDFERTTTYELGIRHSLDRQTVVDAAGYVKQNRDEVVVRRVSVFDPTIGVPSTFSQYQNAGRGDVRGLDLMLERRFSSALSASVGYSYQDATTVVEGNFLVPEMEIAAENSRPHTIAAILMLQLPRDWRPGSTAGAILEGVGLFATFRATSGTPYDRCLAGNALSGELCSSLDFDGLNGARLPTFKRLDLRLTKGFAFGGRTLTTFIDARNLLNSRNVLAVFAATGRTSSSQEASDHRARALSEYAGEATASGTLRPDGGIDLTFGGLTDPRPGCGSWQTESGVSAVPNCIYLIRAEERFGNGDHVFDISEQSRAAESLYQVIRGLQNFTGAPRRVRLGLELAF